MRGLTVSPKRTIGPGRRRYPPSRQTHSPARSSAFLHRPTNCRGRGLERLRLPSSSPRIRPQAPGQTPLPDPVDDATHRKVPHVPIQNPRLVTDQNRAFAPTSAGPQRVQILSIGQSSLASKSPQVQYPPGIADGLAEMVGPDSRRCSSSTPLAERPIMTG